MRTPILRYQPTRALRGAWLVAALLWAGPALAQVGQEAAGQARVLPKRPRWLTGFSAGPSLPVMPAGSPVNSGFDANTTVEYAFDKPEHLWLRASLDVNQYNTIETLAGPGYAYELNVNNTASSLLLDVGYRQNFGRIAPFGYVGAGGAYVSSSLLTGQQNGQTQQAGTESRYTVALNGGLGLEYRLFKSGAIPYTELAVLALPEQRVAGKQLLFFIPSLGVKFPF